MIICADDFGMSEDIDSAILELCASKKLSAVSCMALLKRCDSNALKFLLQYQSSVDVGLHLCFADETLTDLEGNVDSLPTFGRIFKSAIFKKLQSEQIASQIATQYELFVKKAGRKPDYIDGHLHAHQLPCIRQALVEFVSKFPMQERPYARNTFEPIKNLRSRGLPWLKASFIGKFGAQMLKELREAEIPTNDGFAGIYDFKNCSNYPNYFPKFADCLKRENGILVVHPGKNENWRRGEFEILRNTSLNSVFLNKFQTVFHKSPVDLGI